MKSPLTPLVKKVLDNPDGRKLLNALRDSVWYEGVTNMDSNNQYVWIEGKRQMVRDLEEMLQEQKNE